jgi:nicotinate phosphoribosyltransferase
MLRYGVPASGTMDHFAVQAAERPGVPCVDSERDAFAALYKAFPNMTLLVDTYDTPRGIRVAAAATGARLAGIRLDSNVNAESIKQARALLDSLGAPQAKILVSDGLDEHRVAECRAAGADGFGVGENITCVPDAAAGVGCVAKVIVNGYGKITMKLAKGSGKATLPGKLQVYRFADHDLLATAEEAAPAGGTSLLKPIWRGRTAVPGIATEGVGAARERVQAGIAALPDHLRALPTDHQKPWPLVVSDALAARIEQCVAVAEAAHAAEKGAVVA